jgi:hypothetical protein
VLPELLGSLPGRAGLPDGAFWVDADTADRMLRNDSWVITLFDGFPSFALDFG